MIICAIFAHYITLVELPEYKVDFYLNTNTNTCKVYSNRTWDIVSKDTRKGHDYYTLTNGVIDVSGYFYGYE